MIQTPSRLLPLLIALLTLGGCQPAATTTAAALEAWPGQPTANAAQPLAVGDELWLLSASSDGLILSDSSNQQRDRAGGSYRQLSVAPRASANGPAYVAATSDSELQQLVLFALELPNGVLQQKARWPIPRRSVQALCFYHSPRNAQLSLYLLDDRGGGEQWLLAEGPKWRSEPLLLRTLALPEGVSSCATDSVSGSLYLAEERIGVWRYGAEAEDSMDRELVALAAPHGPLANEIRAITVDAGGQLWAATGGDHPALHLLGSEQPPLALSGEIEALGAATSNSGGALALAFDGQPLQRLSLPAQQPRPLPQTMIEVPAAAETPPAPLMGDAMDDPAIWINRNNPGASRVLGTDKRRGLEVYDLAGHKLQELLVGRVNNVDVRYGLQVGEQQIDIAVASQRDRNALALFAIDPASGEVRTLGEISTPLADIYGLCLYQPAGQQRHELFVNDKDGRVLHYRLDGSSGSVSATLVREFRLPSQPEGCVADDLRHRLFIGEEDAGIWLVDARAEAKAEPQLIIPVGDQLVADVEGLAIAQGEKPLLLVSSQGNDSYVLYDAEPPFALRGQFRVGVNSQLGIDGASETDGLEVTTTPLGAPFPAGLMVVQDGRNRMPEAGQSFKLVSWAEVLASLQLHGE